MTDQGRGTPVDDDDIRVVRDATFVRFVADEAVLTPIGRDLDVAFLQYGPIFISQTILEHAEQTNAQHVVTEVARMRMDQPAFLAMTMNYLQAGIASGSLKGEAILRSVTGWLEAAAAAKAEDRVEG